MHVLNTKKIIVSFIIVLFITLFSKSPASFERKAAIHLAVSGYGDSAELFYQYDYFLSCAQLQQLISPTETRRNLLELLILCKIFEKSNLEVDFEMVKTSGYARSIRISKHGIVDMPSESIWNEDIDPERFHKSLPIIKKGQFQKGLYTLKSHPLQKMAPSAIDFSAYSGVSVKNWEYDIQAINDLTSHITESYSFKHLFYMLEANRADFTLMSFPANSDLSYHMENVNLLPIEGVKVALQDSRHFIISKKSKHAKIVIDALNKGIEALNQNNEITGMFEKSNFINTKTKEWKVINH